VKKITILFVIMGLMAISAYVYVRYSLRTPGYTPAQTKDTAVQTRSSGSFLDLKPKLVEKLQQLVKQGSDSLYNLFIHEVKPDVLNSSVTISNALLAPDTAAMKKLEALKQLPDDIFRIKADSIRIDGLGIKDILSKDVIDVKAIHILHPTIDVYSEKRGYNSKTESKTLYQRLLNQLKHIGIEKVIIEKGTLITHNLQKNKTIKFNDIAVNLTNVVIDSSTQFDKNRFLFAKDAELTMKNYSVPTSDKLYTVNVGSVSIKANQQLLVAKNIVLHPHYTKTEFQKHIKTQKQRFEIAIPSIEFRNTDWWHLINNEALLASEADVNKAVVSIYLDKRKPANGNERKAFPHQLLMQLPLKINIAKLKVNDLDLSYEEVSKESGKAGKLRVTNLHGTVTNLTNIPEAVRRNAMTTVTCTGTFMQAASAHLSLRFDLSRYKTGDFTADLSSRQGFDGTMVNEIAEPLGLFMVKRGYLKSLEAHVAGNNNKATGNIVMLYDNLHVTPLKRDNDDSNHLKKKSVTSFIANTFVLKDSNPSKNGEVRKEKASANRGSGTFFNLIWKTTFVGILKTIGAPEKLANQ
jgi:hypothetical protein